jgi:sec-independent protein translocase protein TatB
VLNIGPEKLILLFVIALIVLGPDKLPGAARNAGRMLAEVRRITGGLQNELRDALNDPKDALTAAVADVRNELDGVRQDLGSLGISGGVGATSSMTPWSPPAISQAPSAPPPPDDPSLN